MQTESLSERSIFTEWQVHSESEGCKCACAGIGGCNESLPVPLPLGYSVIRISLQLTSMTSFQERMAAGKPPYLHWHDNSFWEAYLSIKDP